jgi:predicted Zn-dependent protease
MVVLAATLGQVGFHPTEGAFAGRLGQRVLGENVSLVDDGADPDGLPTTFDCRGTPKQRVPLVDRGVAVGVVREETGHAVPPAWRFGGGPSPSHVFLAPGEASDADLLAACDTGLSIQRVDYVRIVHPTHTLVTGSSRDATLWLEGGRPVARVPQFRFTLRLDELFSSLELLGARRERGETPFMESIVAPGAVAAAFPVDVITG